MNMIIRASVRGIPCRRWRRIWRSRKLERRNVIEVEMGWGEWFRSELVMDS